MFDPKLPYRFGDFKSAEILDAIGHDHICIEESFDSFSVDITQAQYLRARQMHFIELFIFTRIDKHHLFAKADPTKSG